MISTPKRVWTGGHVHTLWSRVSASKVVAASVHAVTFSETFLAIRAYNNFFVFCIHNSAHARERNRKGVDVSTRPHPFAGGGRR